MEFFRQWRDLPAPSRTVAHRRGPNAAAMGIRRDPVRRPADRCFGFSGMISSRSGLGLCLDRARNLRRLQWQRRKAANPQGQSTAMRNARNPNSDPGNSASSRAVVNRLDPCSGACACGLPEPPRRWLRERSGASCRGATADLGQPGRQTPQGRRVPLTPTPAPGSRPRVVGPLYQPQTRDALRLSWIVPLPSWPEPLLPQQYVRPSSRRPQV